MAACAGAIVGCAAQQMASLATAPASAQPELDTPRWSYRCFEADSPQEAENQLSQLGVERWELVAATTTYGNDGIFCLKRPRR